MRSIIEIMVSSVRLLASFVMSSGGVWCRGGVADCSRGLSRIVESGLVISQITSWYAQRMCDVVVVVVVLGKKGDNSWWYSRDVAVLGKKRCSKWEEQVFVA